MFFAVIESVLVPHMACFLRGLISRAKAVVSGGGEDPPSIVSPVISLHFSKLWSPKRKLQEQAVWVLQPGEPLSQGALSEATLLESGQWPLQWWPSPLTSQFLELLGKYHWKSEHCWVHWCCCLCTNLSQEREMLDLLWSFVTPELYHFWEWVGA